MVEVVEARRGVEVCASFRQIHRMESEAAGRPESAALVSLQNVEPASVVGKVLSKQQRLEQSRCGNAACMLKMTAAYEELETALGEAPMTAPKELQHTLHGLGFCVQYAVAKELRARAKVRATRVSCGEGGD